MGHAQGEIVTEQQPSQPEKQTEIVRLHSQSPITNHNTAFIYVIAIIYDAETRDAVA